MRILRFNVDDQIIRRYPDCDFKGIVPGSKGYLKAAFNFSPVWKDMVKVVMFSVNGKEIAQEILDRDKELNYIDIPDEVTKNRVFEISVLGGNGKIKVLTNKINVVQDGR